MKSFIVSLLIMLSLCGAIIFNSIYMKNKFEEIDRILHTLPTYPTETYKLEQNYNKYFETLELVNKKWLSLEKTANISIAHDETAKLTESLASALSYYHSKSFVEYANCICLARKALSHIMSHEKLTIDKIL